MKSKKLFVIILIIGLSSFSGLASDPDKPSQPVHKLFLGSGYGSDLVYDGSSQAFSQPFYSGDIYYVYKNRWWLSAVGYKLPGIDNFVPMADFSAGFNHTVNENFDFSVALSSYRTSAEVKETIHDNFTFLRAKAGFDWYYIYSTLSLGTLFAETNSYYIYFRNSKFFRTPTLGNSGIYFSFDPSVNTVFGTSTWYETITSTSPGGFFPGRPGGGTTETVIENTTMNFVKMEFSVPVSFNIKRFSLEADAVYLVPGKRSDGVERKEGFYFFMSAFVRIF
jgi:hypothetical protein